MVACSTNQLSQRRQATIEESQTLCPAARLAALEVAVGSDDGAGHGPDIGSNEWHSAIEFRRGLRGRKDLPKRGTIAWCKYVESKSK